MAHLFIFYIVLSLSLQTTKQLGISEGLSQSTVEAVVRDKKGMLWIGTLGGLNLYDNNEILSFHHDPMDRNSLPSEEIYTLQEDGKGNIWIGTNKGLAVFHPSDFSCETITPGIVHTSIRHKQKLFFGGVGYLYEYDMESGQFYSIKIPSEKYMYLAESDGEKLVLGTSNGYIYKYDISSRSIIPHGQSPLANIYAMFRSSSGDLYVSSYKDGIYLMDEHFNALRHWTSRNSKLSHDIVNDFMEDNGCLLCATDGGGINVLNMLTGTFTDLYQKGYEPGSLPTNSINLLQRDESGNIWAGTVRNGLLCLRSSTIRTYGAVQQKYAGESNGLSGKSIASLFEDDNGTLWIGTDGDGLNSYNPQRDSFRHYASTEGMSICSISNLDKNRLIISIFSKGVFLFDKQRGDLSRFVIGDPSTDESIRKSTALVKVHRIDKDHIVILGRGIFVYDTRERTFTKLDLQGLKNPILSCSDKKNLFLITNSSRDEIYQMDRNTHQITLLKDLETEEDIKTVANGKDGRLYIGSEIGMTVYDPVSDTTFHYKNDIFNSVTYLTFDKAGRLWIAADNSLFTMENGEITSWGEYDGFISNEINCACPDGTKGESLYLGGSEGLVKIMTDKIKVHDEKPIISLWSVNIDGEVIIQDKKEYRIPSRYRVIDLSVCSNESDVFRTRKYRYTIEKSDHNRSVVFGGNHLSLPVLSDGSYTITSSFLKKNGSWTPEFHLMDLTILRPWYRSIVAILIYSIVILSLMNYMRLRNKKRIYELKKIKERHEEHINYCKDYSLLIVGNRKEYNSYLKNELSNCFKKIFFASDGNDGLEIAREQKTDIILSDMSIPEINGMELCRRIREDSSICNATIILMTGKNEPDIATAGYREGADYFIYKPFDIDLLINISYNSLKNKERLRQQYRLTNELFTQKVQTFTLSDEDFNIELERLVLENLGNPDLNVEYLMKKMNYGRTTFYSRVKSVTGMSVSDFINTTRISRAKHIIKSTKLSMSEVAFRVGCNSLSHFSILFKQYTGLTPTEFKKNN